MDKFKDFRKSGSFRLASGVEVTGELSLKGGATSLDLFSSTFFDTHASEDIAQARQQRQRIQPIRPP